VAVVSCGTMPAAFTVIFAESGAKVIIFPVPLMAVQSQHRSPSHWESGPLREKDAVATRVTTLVATLQPAPDRATATLA